MCEERLNQRIPVLETVQSHIAAWKSDRNNQQSKIHWHFFTDDGLPPDIRST